MWKILLVDTVITALAALFPWGDRLLDQQVLRTFQGTYHLIYQAVFPAVLGFLLLLFARRARHALHSLGFALLNVALFFLWLYVWQIGFSSVYNLLLCGGYLALMALPLFRRDKEGNAPA